MNEEKDNVPVPFIPEFELAISQVPKRPRLEPCLRNCEFVEVDDYLHIVECVDCGQKIEPWDYISKLADEGGKRIGTIKYLDTLIDQKRAELKIMSGAYEKVKRQVDKIDRPARKESEQEAFDRRWNPQMFKPHIVPKSA